MRSVFSLIDGLGSVKLEQEKRRSSVVAEPEQSNNAEMRRILRGKDIIPHLNPECPDADGRAGDAAASETASKAPGVPEFDLNDRTLSGHRRAAATRRKKPGRKRQPTIQQNEAGPIGYAIEQSLHELSYEHRIVAEIVAKDIGKMQAGRRRER